MHRHHNKDKLIGSEKYETMINKTLNEHNNNDTLEFEEFEEFEHSHKIEDQINFFFIKFEMQICCY